MTFTPTIEVDSQAMYSLKALDDSIGSNFISGYVKDHNSPTNKIVVVLASVNERINGVSLTGDRTYIESSLRESKTGRVAFSNHLIGSRYHLEDNHNMPQEDIDKIKKEINQSICETFCRYKAQLLYFPELLYEHLLSISTLNLARKH